ncbi:MAG TPA: hypothetical protein VGS20_06170 [Candidatus Acidoferrales bacterium]|nr:hypothetical protein [Candidatus Acidoferrales bacterium]
MNRTALILLAALLGACPRAAAPAGEPEWVEVRSPHFVVDTNAGINQGRDVAAHFEQVRAVFQAAFPKSRVDPAIPPTILAVRNEQDLSQLLLRFWRSRGEEHPAGFFVTDKEKNYVALRVDAANAEQQYHVLYHEYVHLLESLNFPSLPLWASEGLAEFYGSIRIDGDDVGIGYPLRSHLQVLEAAKKLPITVLLTASESSPYYNEADLTSIFYAQSWELTDYLLTTNHGGSAPSFWKYVALVSKGADSLDAARQCFGDLNRLASDVNAFGRQTDFPYYRIKAPFPHSPRNLTARRLSPAESLAVRGDFLVYAGQPAEAQTMLNQAIALDPALPAPYASLGLMAVRANDRATALRWLDRAAGLDSRNYLVYYYRAMLSLGASDGPQVPDEARADLTKCIRLNPSFAEGYRALAQLDASRNQHLEDALDLARHADELDPGQTQNYLTIGMVLMRLGRPEAAAQEAQRAVSSARTPEDRQSAQQFLAQVGRIESAVREEGATVNAVPETTLRGPMPSPQPARRQPEAAPGAAPAQSPGSSQAAAGTLATGTAQDVKCAGPELRFRLATTAGNLDLHAADYTQLRYASTEPIADEFIPCTMLEGRRIAVRYRPASGRNNAGELTEIDLQR